MTKFQVPNPSQIPNPNFQIPKKRNSPVRVALGFEAWGFIGIWDLAIRIR
jgi:hypothetical protein